MRGLGQCNIGINGKNTHVKYESPITNYSKVMPNVKVFEKYVKGQGYGNEVKNFGINGKVLSQGLHMWNMKTPSLTI